MYKFISGPIKIVEEELNKLYSKHDMDIIECKFAEKYDHVNVLVEYCNDPCDIKPSIIKKICDVCNGLGYFRWLNYANFTTAGPLEVDSECDRCSGTGYIEAN